MKRVLILLLPILLLGAAAGGLYKFGLLPWGQPGKKPGRSAPHASAKKETAEAAKEKPAVSEAEANPRRESARPAPRSASSATLNTADSKERERSLTRLTAVYEQMSPEEAGPILARLPDPLVEKMLRRMDERQVGKILLTLDTKRAARLTQALAR